MADIIIKRKITLGFLGEDYKADYLIFKSVPVNDYPKIVDKQPDDNVEATKYIQEILKDQFIEGRFQEQDVAKEDIGKFDGETISHCFALLTGQSADPKE